MRTKIPPLDRLTALSVEVPCLIKGLDLPCWVHIRARARGGYGTTKINGVQMPAHRFSYIELRADIPEGLQLDHLCRVRACWNPWHVEPVTCWVNLARGKIGPLMMSRAQPSPRPMPPLPPVLWRGPGPMPAYMREEWNEHYERRRKDPGRFVTK